MRFMRIFAVSAIIVGCIYLISMILKIFAVMFAPGFNPISIDVSPAVKVAVTVFSCIIVAFIIIVLLDYIPNILRGEEE